MKKISLLLLCILVAFPSFAKRIAEQEAFAIAQKFMGGLRIDAGKRLVRNKDAAQTQYKNLYVFNVERNGGFVIVSGDDRTQSILGYAEQGSLDESTLPSNVKWLFDYYDHAISTLDDAKNTNILHIKTRGSAAKTNISHLIDTQWGQGDPYNTFCPKIGIQKCLTGCVATAMAQVINYNRWPQEQTTAVPSYTSLTNKIQLPELPPVHFDWNNMSNTAIARLMQYCGQAVNMDYGIEASGALNNAVSDALVNVFGYSKSANFVSRSGYSNEQWDNLVYDELSQGRPIVYFGQSTTAGGHAFIVDGYSEGMYHLNWGWNGYCDGYFTLNNLKPTADDGFNDDQQMVINICRPAGVGDIDHPKVVVSAMTCSGSQLDRADAGSDFPAFSVGSTVESDLADKATLQIGLALYNDNGLVKILSSESHEFNPTDKYTMECQITIGSDLPQGNYRIVAVSRVNDTDNWLTDAGSTTNYVDVTIEETSLKLQVMPKSNVDPDIVDFGIHTIDGITYHLYSECENPRAVVEFWEEREKYIGDIYIPDNVNYQNMTFKVTVGNVYSLPELISLSIRYAPDCISSCPKLSRLEIRDGTITSKNLTQFLRVESCPALKSITYPQSCEFIISPTKCESMTSITFTHKQSFKICLDPGTKLWEKESMPALTDVYFACDVPPILIEWDQRIEVGDSEIWSMSPNDNVTIHIPQGTMEVYKRSIWKNWKLVDDQSAVPANVNWDYCGSDRMYNKYGGSNGFRYKDSNANVEFALRIPEENMQPYKGCRISRIEFYTPEPFRNDRQEEDVEYVFLTTRDKDYISKKAVTTIRGTWMSVELDQPYTITGEEIFVGIGKANILCSWWANEDIIEESFWNRFMSNDPNNSDSKTWMPFGNDDYAKHALPIRAVIEGENLPTDIMIQNAEVTEANDKIRLTLKSRAPKLVKQVTFDWDVDGKRKGQQTVETAMLANHTDTVYIDLPKDLSGRNHTVTLNGASIDGAPDEIPSNSEVVQTFVTSGSTFFPRKVVMEEATGTWCGYCPIGIEVIENMTEHYPDNFIAITLHDDDEMRPLNSGYNAFFNMVSSYPTTHINRKYWMYPALFDIDDIKDKGEALITSTAYSSDGKNVEVTTETVFGFNDDSSTGYRVAYVLTEDKVGPYAQNNAYSNPEAEHNPNDMMDWWIHQNGYVATVYNDVARAIYDDYNGIKGVFPNEIKEGQKYTNKYKFTLPENIKDKANLNVVTLLIDGSNGEIMNADRTPVRDPLGIHQLETDSKQFDVYNTMGMKVRSNASSLNGLPDGIYIVNGKKYVHKR